MNDFPFDLDSPVVRLCIAGTEAEYAGRGREAQSLYRQAWDARRSDIEACIAAHYVARHQLTPEDTLLWNRIALEHADAAQNEDLRSFYPSLYVNIAKSYEGLDDADEAWRYHELARQSALRLTDTRYVEMVRNNTAEASSHLGPPQKG